jgi:large repetitive protein
VTLNAVSSPTKDSTPSFSGTASEKTPVTVSVFAAGDVGGTVLAEAHASGTGGSWSSGGASPALVDGTYTAVAEQESAFGNGPGVSEERTFTVHTAKPVVTLNAVSSPTTDSTPSFSGTASEKTTVKVQIYKGFAASGSPVASATASGTGGSWSSGGASPALADGTYTAVAEQESAFGNGPGSSEERTFTVDTKPPSVTLNAISSPNNDSTPSFSGFASDTTEVRVRIFKGSSASGTPSAEAHATGTGGGWSSGAASPALADGSYTAVAVQGSSHGTGEGTSEAIHFTIDTAPPHVTLSAVTSPSGNTSPSFSGTASDTTTVTVRVYAGANAEGAVVATAGASGTGGSWSSGKVSPSLPSGEYTAQAEQSSSLGNGAGTSNAVTFTVDTSSPTVTLNSIATPSNDSTPTFSGTASDTTTVVVRVFDSGNNEVASATGSPSKGGWKSGALSKTLASGSYRAVASQASSLGNPAGMSAPISFLVETESPRVTLDQPPARSSVNTPHFTGSASDTSQVTVRVFQGAGTKGPLVATLEAAVSGGQFSTANTSALPDGKYTAIAEQPSSVGNPPGHSPERTFEIVTSAPSVTFAAVKTPWHDTTPTFTGTASDTTKVQITVYEGKSPEGTVAATAEASGTGAGWESGSVSKALTEGTYTAIAHQASSVAGAGTGTSNSVTFLVQTKSPTVTLNGVKSPLGVKEVAPVFSGTATDPTGVVVHVFEGPTEVAKTEAVVPKGGGWNATSPTLPTGRHTFTATATQESAAGNTPGSSSSIKFTVDTTSPELTIAPIAARSNNRTPAFSGAVSSSDPNPEPIIVHVFQGATQVAETKPVFPSGGKWTSPALSHPLPEGSASYTAMATEASSLGNPEGASSSIAFEVDTEAPTVTIEPIAGASNNLSPSFNGTTSEPGEVTLAVYAGAKPSGTPIRTAPVEVTESQPGKWSWASHPIAKLEARVGQYTVVATQKSALGNPNGSASFVFRVDPGLPTLLLSSPSPQTNTATPVFRGTSDQNQQVTVRIYARADHAPGCAHEGEALADAVALRGGAWTTGAASPPLPDGEYAAIATQAAAVNGTAETAPACFAVDTRAPSVSLASPGSGAALTGGTVSARGTAGTSAHDKPQVTVQLFSGVGTAAAPLQQVVVNSVSGNWSTVLSGLAPGTYTVRAEQSDDAGNVGVSNSSTFAEGAAPSSGPSATFAWYPAQPHTGERITLVSSSTDLTSPITGYAWNLAGAAFVAGGQSMSTSFNSAGGHRVQLQVTDAVGRASVASQTIPVTYPLMRPFPVVRIVTTRAVGRVRLKLLSVQAPPTSTVQVSCAGKGCPLRSQTRTVLVGHNAAVTPLAFPKFERSFPPGATLAIRVYRNGVIGKYTTFRIRRGKLPVRGDACVSSTDPKPIVCPS